MLNDNSSPPFLPFPISPLALILPTTTGRTETGGFKSPTVPFNTKTVLSGIVGFSTLSLQSEKL